MKASNARRLADTVNRENANSQYNKVHRSIDEAAKAGKYEMLALGRGMSQERLARCFDKKEEGSWQIKPGFQQVVNFQLLNLMESFQKIGSGFDIIFCRNLLIYFSKQDQKHVLLNMIKKLKPGGYLFLGHSESITHFNLPLRHVSQTVFQKI